MREYLVGSQSFSSVVNEDLGDQISEQWICVVLFQYFLPSGRWNIGEAQIILILVRILRQVGLRGSTKYLHNFN